MYLLESSNTRRSRLVLHRTVVSNYDPWAEHRHRYKDDGSSKMRPIFLEISFAHLCEGLFCENDDSPIWDKPNELKKFVPNRESIFQRCKIEFQIGDPFFNVAKSNPESGIHFSTLQSRIPKLQSHFWCCSSIPKMGFIFLKNRGEQKWNDQIFFPIWYASSMAGVSFTSPRLIVP